MGNSEPGRRARDVVRRAFPNLMSGAADLVTPGAGVVVRAGIAVMDEVRFGEVTEEAIVLTVIASIELCDSPLLMRATSAHGVDFLVPGLTLRQLAAAIADKTFAPAWERGPGSHFTSAEIARRWSTVAEDLERGRRTFSAELGGSFLLPKQGAGALGRIRTKLREGIAHAQRCDQEARQFASLDFSGGIDRYVNRARDRLRDASVALMYALEDVLRAHAELVGVARQVVPDRIDELFASPDPTTLAAEQGRRAREAAAELLDNARQALADAGEELSGWRAHSTLRDAGDVDLCAIAAADLRFDAGHEANCWLSLGHTIDGARVRFEALTAAIADEMPDELAGMRKRFIGQLNAAYGATGEIHTCYWTVDDMKRRGQPQPIDVQHVKAGRTRFHEATSGACKTVEELAAAVAIVP